MIARAIICTTNHITGTTFCGTTRRGHDNNPSPSACVVTRMPIAFTGTEHSRSNRGPLHNNKPYCTSFICYKEKRMIHFSIGHLDTILFRKQ